MSLRIRQIVFAAHALEPVVRQFATALDLQVAYRDPDVAKFGLENALLPIGDQFLEVVAPTMPDTAAGRHLQRHGDSSYMLILQTDDLDRDRARLQRLGVRVIWQAEHPDIRAVHLHPKDIGAAIVSIDQPVPPDSWRWAGPDWRQHVSASGAQRIVDVTIAAAQPAVLSRRWAEVLGTTFVVSTGDTHHIDIEESTLHFVPSRSGADLIIGYTLATNGPSRDVSICGTQLRCVSTR